MNTGSPWSLPTQMRDRRDVIYVYIMNIIIIYF